MSLETLWQEIKAGGYAGLRTQPEDALGHLYAALAAFSEGLVADAARHARAAAQVDPESRLLREAAVYLGRVSARGRTRVYVDGEAFAAFIRGGGNVPLYAALSQALREVYATYPALSLLDIGVGDGLALLPALTDNITRLDLVEPSAPMLLRTTEALNARGITYRAVATNLQAFMQQAGPRWDVIQATWSLQSIPPEQRPQVFGWLRAHGQRMLLAEFDVPAFDALLAPARVAYMAARYEVGLAEYEGSLVAQGFLMPVFFGGFDHAAARTNWEGPTAGWADDLRAAGFEQVALRRLYPYFWADAYLIDAR